MDNTNSYRDEIRFRSNNVCDEQVSSEPTEKVENIDYMRKLLESLSDCV